MIDHSLSPAAGLGSAYNNRGLAYLRKDNYTKALADFDAAIKLDPENAYAHYNHGLANYHLERYDPAIADFDWLLRRDPNDIYSLGYRGLARIHNASDTAALGDLDLVFSARPGQPMGLCQSRLGALSPEAIRPGA